MARNTQAAPPPVNQERIEKALAKAVCDGDVVNFRLLFSSFSPGRLSSPERIEMSKYAYLLPDAELEKTPAFRQALGCTQEIFTRDHIARELKSNRPAQLPSNLLLPLADNAVRAGKFTSAAQAYELLRIRQRMQDEFLVQGDAALDAADVPKAVQAYLIGAGLAYDYAAFPEPLPAVPDYQTRALMLHAEYAEDLRDCVALMEPEAHVRKALEYLLRQPEVATRLDKRPLDLRVRFAVELVHRIDPEWETFAGRYREACAMANTFGERLKRGGPDHAAKDPSLADEIEETFGEDPRCIAAHLLGRTIPEGEWWQYLKELAYLHPASVLFVARPMVGDCEFLVPRYRADSLLVAALGLSGGMAAASPAFDSKE